MAKAFSIRDFMDDVRQQDESDVSEKINIYDIGINPKNKYTMSDIEKIKDSIYALGGVQQNVILVRCPEGAEYKYLALDGHRRLAASRELVEEGYKEFELIPAVIKGQIDTDTEDAMLVLMNSTQRNKTDWEKVMEHMRLKEIIPRLKKRQGIDGRTRDIEADMLGISRGQISIYNTIGTRLTPKLMNLFENGDIGISLAHEAAQLEPELQQKLVDITLDKGVFTEEDVRQTVGSRPIKEQMVIEINDDKNVPESGTFKEPGQMKTLDPETQYDAENKAAPPTDDEILCLYNRMIKEYDGNRKELVNILKDNLGRSYSGFHCSEYDYQFSPKGVRINFSHYTTSYAELVRRLNTLVPEKENVPESGTFENVQNEPVPAAEKETDSVTCEKVQDEPVPVAEKETDSVTHTDILRQDTELEKTHAKLRGGYNLNIIDEQIRKYEVYLNMLNNDKSRVPNVVAVYNCILDALELLKTNLLMQWKEGDACEDGDI